MAEADYDKLNGSERFVVHGAWLSGPAPAHEIIQVSLHLRRKPGSPSLPDHGYWATRPVLQRLYLTRAQLGNLYGADAGDITLVEQFASAAGLTVVRSDSARRLVMLSGTVAQVNQAFHVDIGHYESPDNRYRGHEGFVELPHALIGVVDAVFGLDTRRVARPLVASAVITPPSLSPVDVTRRYNFPKLPSAMDRETIALLEFSDPAESHVGASGFWLTDIQGYFTTSQGIGPGYRVPALQVITIAGPGNIPQSGELVPDGEIALDIEVAGAVAQGANIHVYFTTWDEQGWVLALKRIVHPDSDDPTPYPTVVSISLGAPEFEGDQRLTWSPAAMHVVSECFAEAAAIGVTVLVAAGDGGSSCGVLGPPARARVLYPASDPWVIACGGSVFNIQGKEAVWPSTGGGISDYFDLPPWQRSAQVPPSCNGDRRIGRGIPDIAGYAGGYAVLIGGKTYPAVDGAGTSGVAPLYAGLVAILNATLGHPIGYLNPTLYNLAVLGEVFNDITDGGSNASNGAPGYSPGAGWDACTGFGSVNGNALLTALQRKFV